MLWNRIAGWRMGVLLVMLGVIALILVLPQVDLPDTAFHEDNAPAVQKTRIASTPAVVVLTVRSRLSFLDENRTPRYERRVLAAHPISTPLPILHSALLC
jgi:hypothetical protein